MTGALWAVTAGVGFGLFQTVNRRAVQGLDVYLATFLQLAVSAVILSAASVGTEDLGLLAAAPSAAVASFIVAGLFHFFVGWTLLNASQKRIGAARTSPLIGTTPLFGTVIAAAALRELPPPLAIIGIVVVVAGVILISSETAPDGGSDTARASTAGRRGSLFGLGAALVWAISPIFIRYGLTGLPSPLLGVTVGMVASVAAYGVVLLARGSRASRAPVPRDAVFFKLVAGVLVGLSVWARWIALALAPVGVVLALTLMSVPVVLVLSPRVVGRHLERVTSRIWLGAGLTVGGCLVLVLPR